MISDFLGVREIFGVEGGLVIKKKKEKKQQ